MLLVGVEYITVEPPIPPIANGPLLMMAIGLKALHPIVIPPGPPHDPTGKKIVEFINIVPAWLLNVLE